MTRKRAMANAVFHPYIPILHVLKRSIRILKRRTARRADGCRASGGQRYALRILPKSIREGNDHHQRAKNQDKDDGNAAIAYSTDRLRIDLPIARPIVDVNPCEEDGLRNEPVHDAHAGHERKRVRVRELQEIGAALDTAWCRHAQGLALEGIARPFPAEQLARKHAVVSEVKK